MEPRNYTPYSESQNEQLRQFVVQNHLKIIPQGGSIPLIRDWPNRATSDPSQIESWFSSTNWKIDPESGASENDLRFGIVCAKSGIVAVDCDTKGEAGNGIEQFEKICADLGVEPSPVYQDTKSGGRHYIYKGAIQFCLQKIRYQGVIQNIDVPLKIASDLPGRSGYKWNREDWSDAPDLPQELADLFSGQKTLPKTKLANSFFDDLINEVRTAPEGQRNETLTQVAGKISRRSSDDAWDFFRMRLAEAGMEAGLSSSEIGATLAKQDEYRSWRNFPGLQSGEPEAGVFGSRPLPLPVEALSPELKKFVFSLADGLYISREMIFGVLLSQCAGILGRARGIELNEVFLQVANLFVLIIGKTNSGKTRSYKNIFAPLRKIVIEEEEENEREFIEYNLAMEEWNNNGGAKPEKPREFRFFFSDRSTPESIVFYLRDNPDGVFIHADEATEWALGGDRYTKKGGSYGGAHKADLITFFDSGDVEAARATRETGKTERRNVGARNATASWLGTIQGLNVPNMFNEMDILRNFHSRFLYIRATELPRKKRKDRRPLNADAKKALKRYVERLWAIRGTEVGRQKNSVQYLERGKIGEPLYIPVDAEGINYFFEYMDLYEDRFRGQNFCDYVLKFEQQAVRLILNLHYMEWAASGADREPGKISAQTVARALLLIDWFLTTASQILPVAANGCSTKTIESNFIVDTMARIVCENETAIKETYNYKVPNEVWGAWLAQKNLLGTPKEYAPFVKSLGINVDTKFQGKRVKGFTDAVLKKCEILLTSSVNLMEEFQRDFFQKEFFMSALNTESVHLESQSVEIVDAQPLTEYAPVHAVVNGHKNVAPTQEIYTAGNKYNFVHLHNHSDYSFRDGITRIPQMIAKAKECKMQALALTDHGNLFGAWKFYNSAMAAGIKPIIGMEAYYAGGKFFEADKKSWGEIFHLTLLAKNNEGYFNLLRLASAGWQNKWQERAIINYELLKKYSGGLIAMSACLGGEIPQAILNGRDPQPVIDRLQGVFGDDFYLEWMENDFPKLEIVNPVLKDLSQKNGIALVATNDNHYLYASDKPLQAVIAFTAKYPDSIGSTCHFKTPLEMEESFPDAAPLKQTWEIAQKCKVELEKPEKHFFPSSGFEHPEDKLRELVFDGLAQRKRKDDEIYIKRLEYELEQITQFKFSDYMLIVKDVVDFVRKHKIRKGPGRGSAVGSLVCFCLGITDLDPIKYELLFERFINPERVSLPDIDLDFDSLHRKEIIEYVREKYGEVVSIGTVGTLRGKSAIRAVARGLSGNSYVPDVTVNALADAVPEKTALSIAELDRQGAFNAIRKDSKVKKLLDYAARLEGTISDPGVHASGIIIADHPVIEHAPTWINKEEILTTQYDMGDIEELGLVKIDFLGLGDLSIIEGTLANIQENGKQLPDINEEKPEVFDLYKNGDTAGIFQVEGKGITEHLKKLKPNSLEDLSVALALYRPGPLESGMAENFLTGATNAIRGFENLKDILEPTNGVIVYQEQIMMIAQRGAGFTLGQADIMRRAMGKKDAKLMEEQKAAFLDGAEKLGHSRQDAEKLFEILDKFAGYGFNKSHSVAYAALSYQMAYLKKFFPAEFFAASIEKDKKDIPKLLPDCKNFGRDIEIRFPTYKSATELCYGQDKTVWLGVSGLKGMNGRGLLENLPQNPKNLFDLLRRWPECGKREFDALARIGFFDDLIDGDQNRAVLCENSKAVFASVNVWRKKQGEPEKTGHFGFPASVVFTKCKWTELEKLANEADILGYWRRHPIDLLKDTPEYVSRTSLNQCKDCESEMIIFARIDKLTKKTTKNKKPYLALEISDDTGKAACKVWENVLEMSPEVKAGDIVRMICSPDSYQGNFQLNVRQIEPVDMSSIPEPEITQPSPLLETSPLQPAGEGQKAPCNSSILAQ